MSIEQPSRSSSSEQVLRRFENHYRLQRLLVSSLDLILRVVPKIVAKGDRSTLSPRRVLLSNAGHLGDVIISTALLPVLHRSFPEIEIGFLTGSHSRSAVQGHPLITRTHILDHWYLRRDDASRPRRMAEYYFSDVRKAIREIARHDYDVSIDLRAWFPNFIPVLWRANIPLRIGFDRVGFSALLTHAYKFRYNRKPELEYQFELLESLGIDRGDLPLAHPSLPPISSSGTLEAQAITNALSRYRVLHMAASTSTRDWPSEHWIELATSLVTNGITPVLTGRGPRDASLTGKLAATVPGCINACDRLSWDGLVAMVAGAELVYSVETSVGHLAAALKRPVVSIYGGMADPQHWKPYGDTAEVATNLTDCHPCFNKLGCRERECLTELEAKVVISTANRLIEKLHSRRSKRRSNDEVC